MIGSDNVLIDVPLAGQAVAQTTPFTYCASLPPVSCEVLNVEVSISGTPTNGTASGHGIIKYCRNGDLAIAPFILSPGTGGGSASTLMFRNGAGTTWVTAIAPTVGSTTAWFATNLCASLP